MMRPPIDPTLWNSMSARGPYDSVFAPNPEGTGPVGPQGYGFGMPSGLAAGREIAPQQDNARTPFLDALVKMVPGAQYSSGLLNQPQVAGMLSGAQAPGMLQRMMPPAPDRFDNERSLMLQLKSENPAFPESTRDAMRAGTLPPIINPEPETAIGQRMPRQPYPLDERLGAWWRFMTR